MPLRDAYDDHMILRRIASVLLVAPALAVVGCAILLDSLSLPSLRVHDAPALVGAIIGTVSGSSTIVGSIGAARENARSIRDQMSGEVFEALNATHIALSRGMVFAASPGAGTIAGPRGMLDRPHLSRARQLLAQIGE